MVGNKTENPTAAVICLLSTVTNLLQNNHYVIVISLDFSQTRTGGVLGAVPSAAV